LGYLLETGDRIVGSGIQGEEEHQEVHMNPRVGLAVVGNETESGLERASSLSAEVGTQLERRGIVVTKHEETVVTDAGAIQAGGAFRNENVDLVVLIHATWARDSIPYLITQCSGAPLFLWGLPYPETYSLAAVQHFAGILSNRGIGFKLAYGMPSEDSICDAVDRYARVAKAAHRDHARHIGLIGPRSTWRTFGSQDMTPGEWDLGDLFGATVIHIEMTEFLEAVKRVSPDHQKELVQAKAGQGRLPTVEPGEEKRLLAAAAETLAIEELRERYQLDAATIETYPYAWGTANLAASWLGDEGFVLETEGDLARTTVMQLLGDLSSSPSMLGEMAHIDSESGTFYLGHAGSCALSLAATLDEVSVVGEGETGCFVQFPIRKMDTATLVNVWEDPESYRLFAGRVDCKGMPLDEWRQMGGVSLAKLEADWAGGDLLSFFANEGMEHHFVLVEGDLREDLCNLADLFGLSATTV